MAVDQNWRWVHNLLGTLDLQKVAWNISTFGGRQRMAAKKGGNIDVSYRDGTLWTPKDYEENELDLAMWVVGCGPDGEIPSDPSTQFQENLQTLRRMFNTDNVMGFLYKLHPVAGVDVVATCEIRHVIDFTTQAGATRAAFIVQMVIPEIWFRPLTLSGDESLTSRANGATWAVDIDSDVFMKDGWLTFQGDGAAASNFKLFNDSLGASHWMEYLGVVDPGETVIVDVKSWKATKDAVKVTGALNWSGQPQIFWLIPGVNNLRLVTNNAIKVQVAGRGAYW